MVQTGTEKRIKGHGMPNRKTGGKVSRSAGATASSRLSQGDLIIRFRVKFPTSLPSDRVQAVKDALQGL